METTQTVTGFTPAPAAFADLIPCENCSGTGRYLNRGIYGDCYGCEGKGVQDGADRLRNAAYWRYRFGREAHAMFATPEPNEDDNTPYVCFSGPEPVQNRDGDEIPVWCVQIMLNDDEELKCYTVHSFERAHTLGLKIAADRNIEFVNDASPA